MSHNVHQGSVPEAVREGEGSGDAATLNHEQRNIIRQSPRHLRKPWNAQCIGSWTMKVPDTGYYVYVAWGHRTVRPLYVGMSGRLFSRMSSHILDQPWGDKVRRFQFYAFATHEEAAYAEARAIIDLNPRYNVRRIEPAFRGIADDQLEIIRRVQNRTRQDSEGGQG